MTPEEWVDEIDRRRRRASDSYVGIVHSPEEIDRAVKADVIRAAIEEEREACLDLLRQQSDEYLELARRWAEESDGAHPVARSYKSSATVLVGMIE
jgi:hypothetical protein